MPWLAPTRRRRAHTSQRTHDFRIDLACVYAQRLETMRSSPLIHLDATRSPTNIEASPAQRRARSASLAVYSSRRSGHRDGIKTSCAVASIRQHPRVAVRYRAGTLCLACIRLFPPAGGDRCRAALPLHKRDLRFPGGKGRARDETNPARDETILCFPRKDPETIAA